MPWYAFLFAPLALIFRVITGLRNFLYDHSLLRSHRSPIPTLVVGNLSVGGTGKTPMVEFLIRQLRQDFNLISLSRGYGRKTKGFIKASPLSTPDQLGDESLQIYRKFGGEVQVFVGEDRVAALEEIAKVSPLTDLAILDDAFQHRRLRGDLYCLLTPFYAPFTRDHLLPMGRLRESRGGARRADLLVVTKCPEEISLAQKENLRNDIRTYLRPDTGVFFSKIGYGDPYPLDSKLTIGKSAILLSGLANDQPFVAYCKKIFEVLDVISFADHQDYSPEDLKKIIRMGQKHLTRQPFFLTTEKDAVKLKSLANQGYLGEIPIFVLPIAVNFDPTDEDLLLTFIREKFIQQ